MYWQHFIYCLAFYYYFIIANKVYIEIMFKFYSFIVYF